MSQVTDTVASLCVLSTHGVPLLIRCVGGCAPPKRALVGILNAVFQSVKQQALGSSGAVTTEYAPSMSTPHATPDPRCAAGRPAMLLHQLRTLDTRVSFRSYSPADILLVLVQSGGAGSGDDGAISLLDMCYQAIVLLNGEYEGVRSAKDNPQSFQRRLRVSVALCVALPAVAPHTRIAPQSITYYLDTIIGGDSLLYPVSAGVGEDALASTARDRVTRASVAAISATIRAPNCVLVPYKTAFALRRILTAWVNRYGAFAAVLVAGPCGSMICTTDPNVAAATEEWYVGRWVRPWLLSSHVIAGLNRPIRPSWRCCSCCGPTTSRAAKMTSESRVCG